MNYTLFMQKIGLIIGVCLLSIVGYAQQDPQFTQNMHSKLFPNPAVAGSNNAICATVLGRYQWMGFAGRPETYLLSVHGPFSMLKQSWGAGLSISQDKIGNDMKTFGAKAALAYRRPMGNGKISAGLGLGMINIGVGAFANEDAIDGVDNDDAINASKMSDTGFDMDLGLYYNSDKLYLGLSTTHLTQAELKGGSTEVFNVKRHYYVTAGYNAELGPDFVLQPSVFVKSEAASTQIDLNVSVVYKQQVWAGLSYRFIESIAPMIGVNWPVGTGDIKFGYSYDITTSGLRTYNSGTHELMLGYCFGIEEKNKVDRHKTVRFL